MWTFSDYKDGYKGKTQAELDDLLYTAQTVYFVTIVLMQFGNLHSIRTRHRSWFQQNPFKYPTKNLFVCFFFFFIFFFNLNLVYCSFY